VEIFQRNAKQQNTGHILPPKKSQKITYKPAVFTFDKAITSTITMQESIGVSEDSSDASSISALSEDVLEYCQNNSKKCAVNDQASISDASSCSMLSEELSSCADGPTREDSKQKVSFSGGPLSVELHHNLLRNTPKD
jgi:uncharacterized protein YcsI (UPF0317 family)